MLQCVETALHEKRRANNFGVLEEAWNWKFKHGWPKYGPRETKKKKVEKKCGLDEAALDCPVIFEMQSLCSLTSHIAEVNEQSFWKDKALVFCTSSHLVLTRKTRQRPKEVAD